MQETKKAQMEELKNELKKAQEKRRTAKRRHTNFGKDVPQVVVLENKIHETLNRLLEKKAKYASVLNIRARLQKAQNKVMRELAEVQVAVQHCENYHNELGKELRAAERMIAEAQLAIQEYQDTGVSQSVSVPRSRQEPAWAISRTLSEDYSQIQKLSWTTIFPTLWTRCGWRSCLFKKSSLRKQFMCPHLVSRYFLHLDVKQLMEEKSRWQSIYFATVDKKFRELAAELASDIEDIIARRTGGEDYLWKQKKREWYPDEIESDAAPP